MNKYEITNKQKHQFNSDGVVVLRGLFTGLVDMIALAVEQNLASPGPYAAENLLSNEGGRFLMITATGKDCQLLSKSYMILRQDELQLL